jgi:hypothetical protein
MTLESKLHRPKAQKTLELCAQSLVAFNSLLVVQRRACQQFTGGSDSQATNQSILILY